MVLSMPVRKVRSCQLPALPYACKIWTLKSDLRSWIYVFGNKCLCRIKEHGWNFILYRLLHWDWFEAMHSLWKPPLVIWACGTLPKSQHFLPVEEARGSPTEFVDQPGQLICEVCVWGCLVYFPLTRKWRPASPQTLSLLKTERGLGMERGPAWWYAWRIPWVRRRKVSETIRPPAYALIGWLIVIPLNFLASATLSRFFTLLLFMGISNLSGSLVQPSINFCFRGSPV